MDNDTHDIEELIRKSEEMQREAEDVGISLHTNLQNYYLLKSVYYQNKALIKMLYPVLGNHPEW